MPAMVELPRLAVGVVDLDVRRRRRLAATLDRGGIAVVAEALDAEGLAVNGAGRLDAVVLGADALGVPELEAIARVRGKPLESRVVAVIGSAGRRAMHGAVDAGANGVVLEDRLDECLALAVRAACAGQLTLPIDWRETAGTPTLSVRQKQVLAMVVLGCSNKEIARDLGLQEATVKLHMKTLYRKIGAQNRTQAALIAREMELF